MSWSAGPAVNGASPDHYEVAIPISGIPLYTGFYHFENVDDSSSDTTLAIPYARSLLGGTDVIAEVKHCDAAGDCSEALSISFTLNPIWLSVKIVRFERKALLTGDSQVPMGDYKGGMMDYFDVVVTGDAPAGVSLSDYSFRLVAPAGTGILAATTTLQVCEWSRPATGDWSSWGPAGQTIPLVRCGRGDGASEITVEARDNLTQQEFLADYEVTIEQSWHRADHQITYALKDPLISGDANAFVFILTYSIEMGAAVWDAVWSQVYTGDLFDEVDDVDTADVVVYGYSDPCDGGHACTTGPSSGSYPHLGQQELRFAYPLSSVQQDHKRWTDDFFTAKNGPSFYTYLPMVMAHEFGHTAGLGHAVGHQEVMAAGYSPDLSHLSPLEQQALQKLYNNHIAHFEVTNDS